MAFNVTNTLAWSLKFPLTISHFLELFPLQFLALQSLTSLALPTNYLSGNLPSELAGCANLKFGKLTSLVALGHGGNDYDEGKLPDSFGKLKKVYWLFLAGSNLTEQIPESIFEINALGTLDILNNRISGNVPKSISKLQNLFKIELYQNNLIGELPVELVDLIHLQEIDVSRNQLHGTLPKGIDSLKNLTHLNGFAVYSNSFTGEIPANLVWFSPLNSIDISENNNLQNLLAVEISCTEEFPDNYASCKTLTRYRVSQNQLSGRIAEGLWGLPDVRMIDFSDNNFTGTVSPGIGAGTKLNQLVLSNNRFSGELPKEHGKLTQLERQYFDNNEFSGIIPSELGTLKQISSLYLEKNSLSG
ncbi:hypothetical protein KY290_007861 [Solanum tuberosum]|uniref:Serine-threonine protein kinase, plant-type n=1 Tax=Solanum tuberosum TaxID=4113 RepID=A0ABQ7W780_SOLTU|nr:hypothetical protein KY290_007861 [Solanum tuberosum]